MAQLSVALSDAFVSASALYAALHTAKQTSTEHALATAGFFAIACAASAGVLRFSIASRPLINAHARLTALATVLGVPCINLGFFISAFPDLASLVSRRCILNHR